MEKQSFLSFLTQGSICSLAKKRQEGEGDSSKTNKQGTVLVSKVAEKITAAVGNGDPDQDTSGIIF